MITSGIKEVILSHTSGMNPLERRRSAQVLIRRYGITEFSDIEEIAQISEVDISYLKPASEQKKLY